MDNNNNNNQDYIDLREGFAQDYPPEFQPAPPPEFAPPVPEFNFGPKNSNFFMFILIAGVVFVTIALGLVPRSVMANIPTWVRILGGQILVLGIPCTVYLIAKRRQIKDILPLRPLGWRNILMIIVLTFSLMPLLGLANIVSQLVFPNVIAEAVEGVMLEGGLWLSLLVFAFVAPVFEEVAFRGIGFAGFRHVKIGTAAIINGLVFGFLHMNMNQFTYAFLGGVVFCYMMYYTKSIWAPILSHFIINASFALVQFSLAGNSGGDIDFQTAIAPYISEGGLEIVIFFLIIAFFFLFCTAIFIAIYILFKRHNIKRNTREGIITNTALAARQAGLRPQSGFTWSFWAAAGIFAFMMFLYYVVVPMVENGL